MTKAGRFLLRLLRFLLDTYYQLKPCRFGIAMALLGAIVFIYSDQGAEVLRALAERRANEQGEYLTGATGVTRLIAFGAGTFLWCVASWYTARVLLYLDLPTSYDFYLEQNNNWSAAHRWLARNVPRLLGAAPFAVIGYSMLRAAQTYEVDPPKLLQVLGYSALAASGLLWWALYKRRQILEARAKKADDSASAKATSVAASARSLTGGDPRAVVFDKDLLRSISEAERVKLKSLCVLPVGGMKSAHRVLVTAGIASLIVFVLFTVDPIRFAGGIGTGAVLTLAAATWVLGGSALVYWGRRIHVPLLTLLLLLAALFSVWNDNHSIRVVAASEKLYPRHDLERAFSDWRTHILEKYKDRPKHPLFIVSAEGGGIRAAYWTAAVLGAIQDRDASFADHVFAISGVSGGSLGAAVFAALLAEGDAQGQYAQRAEEMLGQDFLSPAVAAMLYPDFLQRFCPYPFTFLDRGHWLEQSWEKAWRETARKHGQDNNQFAQRFCSLWKPGNHYVPLLFLNATSVENGNRVIASNIVIHPENQEEFLDADDVMDKIGPGVDVPLSTAAHLSARFTYVSPAARFPGDNSHAVDGGYFENSGGTTGVDILRQLNLIMNKPDGTRKEAFADVVPKVIMISNSPTGTAFWKEQCPKNQEEQRKQDLTIQRELNHSKSSSFLEDTLAPPNALLHTRDARGVYAQREIGYRPNGFSSDSNKQVYFFSLAQTTVPLPLGWMLSNHAAEAIQLELYDTKEAATGQERICDCFDNQLTWNTEERDSVIAALHGQLQ